LETKVWLGRFPLDSTCLVNLNSSTAPVLVFLSVSYVVSPDPCSLFPCFVRIILSELDLH
jgi:hypothetical protein